MRVNVKGKKAWLIGFGSLALILILFIFYKLFINQIVLSTVNKYLHENLGSSVSAASYDFSIFPFRFSMDHPVISALGKDPGHAFLKADKITIGVTWDLVLGRKIHFGHILFFRPRILVEMLKDGSNNLPVIDLAPDAEPLPEIIINQLSIKEMKLILRHETKRLILHSPSLNIEMKSKENSDYHLAIGSSGQGELSVNGRRREINKLRLNGLLSPERLFIENALIQSERSDLEISGILNNGSSVHLDLQVKGNIFPEDYADLLPPGVVNHESVRLGQLRFGLRLFRDRKILALRDIRAAFLGGEILGHGEFSRSTENKSDHLALHWKDVDFSLSKGVLPVSLFAYGSGNVNLSFSDFKVSGMEGSLNAQFKPKALRPQNREGAALAGDLQLDFRRGTIRVKKMSLQSQGNLFKGELNIAQDEISGSISGKIDHLRGILQFLSPFNESARWLAEKKIDGEMMILGSISGTTAHPGLRLEITQGKIKNLMRFAPWLQWIIGIKKPGFPD